MKQHTNFVFVWSEFKNETSYETLILLLKKKKYLTSENNNSTLLGKKTTDMICLYTDITLCINMLKCV